MKGDRIKVQTSLLFGSGEGILPVYSPRKNPDGSFMTSFDGSVLLEKIGGVKLKSLGTVTGEPVQVHKNQLEHLQKEGASLSGTHDFVSVVPIYFDAYKLIGYLPTDHYRVVGGSRV